MRDCLHHSDDHDQCLELMGGCLGHQQSEGCSEEVVRCVAGNKGDIVQCYDLINQVRGYLHISTQYLHSIYNICTVSTQCSATQHTQQAAVRDCYGYIELCYAAAGDSAADQVGCWPVIGCCVTT